MNGFDAGVVKWWASVDLREQVFLGSVDNWSMLVWCVLRFVGPGVLVFDEELIDVPIHCEAAVACDIVPGDVNACELTA